MAHCVTRLTGGTKFKGPDEGASGIADLTTQEIAAAAGTIKDSLRYWAVMAYVCDQHPSAEDWPLLMRELQNVVVLAWNKTKRPKTMSLDTVHGIAASAWYEFVAKERYTDIQRAAVAKMKRTTFSPYKDMHARAYQSINTAMHSGLRQISAQVKDSDND